MRHKIKNVAMSEFKQKVRLEIYMYTEMIFKNLWVVNKNYKMR